MSVIIDNIGNIIAILLITLAIIVVIIALLKRRKTKTVCGFECAFCDKPCAEKDDKKQ